MRSFKSQNFQALISQGPHTDDAFSFVNASRKHLVKLKGKDFMASYNSIHQEGVEKKEPTPLEKHVMFFDINKDGVIYPWETYQGFRKIGSGIFLSVFASIFINAGLSRKTRPGKWPSLLFPIEVKNIKLAKHGSDSGAYDTEGRFVQEKFEEIFRKHARSNGNALTAQELDEMLKANEQPKDSKGRIAALSEWKILYFLCKDQHGLLGKEKVRGVYDGSLFEQMAKEHQSKNCKLN
ncbi:PREDICTED: probable peroxygenase 5 isoform X2 [Nicotiana attenuata]|uniref:probable peroxygenase 5 isoform X2 n=1 Tax=Nicotiana attenuata TaxID=49451 RepID=UPI0009050D3B|nr:PREDICTED: probable peroxygenase 5 isoform X2 [Nicotiana attenuata]